MKLAATTIDLGLFSDNPDMPGWYPDVLGAPLVEVLQHSSTYQERFYRVGAGCLKINYSSEAMPAGRSGYRELVLGRDGITEAAVLSDPDGLPIRLVPTSELGGAELGIRMAVADPDRQRAFYCEALGAEDLGKVVRLGDALFEFSFDPQAGPASPTWSRGFNYFVLFVDDTPAAHAALVAAGAQHGLRPLRLGDRCIFSWLRDPCGNWFELVQRAQEDRPLDPVDLAGDHWGDIVEWRTNGTVA